MKRIKTVDLVPPALDYAVALVDGHRPQAFVEPDHGQAKHRPLTRWVAINVSPVGHTPYSPSTAWAQGGPLIERERVMLMPGVGWLARKHLDKGHVAEADGETPLIAAMRCLVAYRLGEGVGIPDELL